MTNSNGNVNYNFSDYSHFVHFDWESSLSLDTERFQAECSSPDVLLIELDESWESDDTSLNFDDNNQLNHSDGSLSVTQDINDLSSEEQDDIQSKFDHMNGANENHQVTPNQFNNDAEDHDHSIEDEDKS